MVECRLAAVLLGRALQLPIQQIRNIKTLSDIEKVDDLLDKARDVLSVPEWPQKCSSAFIAQSLVKQYIEEGEYSVNEVISH